MAKKKKSPQTDLFGLLKKTPEKKRQKPPPVDLTPPSADTELRQLGETFMNMTVDQWIDDHKMPTTLRFTSPHGDFYLTKNRKSAARIAEAGHVVFTPLEVERFVRAMNFDKLQRAERLERGEGEGPPAIDDTLIAKIYEMKKLFPGNKMSAIIIQKDGSISKLVEETTDGGTNEDQA